MDASRTSGGAGGGSSGNGGGSKQAVTRETPEQLLDVFKAAALSVTKLYKTSALAESRARLDGYQDCLGDLHGFLDRENLGLCDGEGWKIRQWAAQRLDDGRRSALPSTESEDETERAAERAESSPETMPRGAAATAEPQIASAAAQTQQQPKADSPAPRSEEPVHFVVPSQDTFNFQSSHQYPNIATLDLSDSRSHETSGFPSRAAKARLTSSTTGRTRTQAPLGRGAGTKRRINFDDFFGGCFGGKDPFNTGGKRGRHA